jgi:aryl-alcohol dehydrogenase-like predicted oxidoreductase
MYGHGLAERELGQFLRGRRDSVTIGTKFGIPASPMFERWPVAMYAEKGLRSVSQRFCRSTSVEPARRLSTRDATESLSRSLRALQTDWVDVLFVHEPRSADAVAILALSDWLVRQKHQGKARYLGLAGNARECADIARQAPGLFDILQVEDSLAGLEADAVLQSGYPLQITFGYLRQALAGSAVEAPNELLRAALRRNPEGMVLVSSRSAARVREFGQLAERGPL